MQIRPRDKLTETSKHAKDTSIFNQVSTNSLLIMQIRPTGKSTEISKHTKDTRNCLAKFEDKIL